MIHPPYGSWNTWISSRRPRVLSRRPYIPFSLYYCHRLFSLCLRWFYVCLVSVLQNSKTKTIFGIQCRAELIRGLPMSPCFLSLERMSRIYELLDESGSKTTRSKRLEKDEDEDELGSSKHTNQRELRREEWCDDQLKEAVFLISWRTSLQKRE